MAQIENIKAREVLDSRGNPTVEVDILLSDGAEGTALVPSGASTGANEALELRDGGDRYMGKGVLSAISNVHDRIAPEILGREASNQEQIDDLMMQVDGTDLLENLGANAVLGVSLALARAAAQSAGQPLYQYLNQGRPFTLPVPMLNIINGGRHADNSTDFQEFMVIPAGFDTFRRALQAGVEIYHTLKNNLRDQGLSTNVGDEGGFAPTLGANRDAVELILKAIESAGYKPGKHVFLGMDVAASEFSPDKGSYVLKRPAMSLTSGGLLDVYDTWLNEYPFISIEDGLGEDDWESWGVMTERLGSRVQLVGDDVYTTNPTLIRKGIKDKTSNAVLVKLNQIGTVTRTLEAIRATQEAGWGVVISHRSGETEDSSIADLAVGTSAGQIKAGAPTRGERTAKYNRLLRIEEELGDKARYAGMSVYEKFLK
ncbi:MAG: phosphopyruvate hydratase [Chloroflexi bacterium]|nr:phosphopyruvate hydratase [Chloroflexota bacterium]